MSIIIYTLRRGGNFTINIIFANNLFTMTSPARLLVFAFLLFIISYAGIAQMKICSLTDFTQRVQSIQKMQKRYLNN